MKALIVVLALALVGCGSPPWELRQTGEVRKLSTNEFIKTEPARTWAGSKFAEDGKATFATRAECDQQLGRMLEAASSMPRLVGGRLPNGVALFDQDDDTTRVLTWTCAQVGSK